MSKGSQFILLWVSILILIIISTFHNRISKKNQKQIVFVLSVVYAFMYAYRTLGLDLINYEQFYLQKTASDLLYALRPDYIFTNNFEPLYVAYIYLSKSIGLTFQQSSFLYLLVAMVLIYRLIVKYTEEPLVSFTLFIITFLFYFDLTRMFFAIAVGLTAYMSKNKIFKILLYGIAFFNHYTIIFLVVYEIFSKRGWLSKLKLPTLMIGSIGVAAVLRFGLTYLTSLQYKAFTKLGLYMNRNSSYESTLQMVLLIITSVYPIIYGLYLYRKYYNDPEFQGALSHSVINTLKAGAAAAIVSLFVVNLRASARVMLPAIAPLFLCFAEPVSNYIYDGKIGGKGLNIYFTLLLYDVFMSLYYLWVAVVY